MAIEMSTYTNNEPKITKNIQITEAKKRCCNGIRIESMVMKNHKNKINEQLNSSFFCVCCFFTLELSYRFISLLCYMFLLFVTYLLVDSMLSKWFLVCFICRNVCIRMSFFYVCELFFFLLLFFVIYIDRWVKVNICV